MELILNGQKIKSIRGSLCSLCYGWYVQCRNGRFYCYYRSKKWWPRKSALRRLVGSLELLKANGLITDYKPTKKERDSL